MMKGILFIFILFLSFNLLSQDYPRYELNEKGEKVVVVITLEQAQKIDNDLDVYELLKVSKLNCDSLNLSYLRVIDEKNKQIIIYKSLIDENNKQIIDKDKQISILTNEIKNLKSDVELCNKQNSNYEKEKEILKKSANKKIIIGSTAGLVVGVIGTIFYFLSHK